MLGPQPYGDRGPDEKGRKKLALDIEIIAEKLLKKDSLAKQDILLSPPFIQNASGKFLLGDVVYNNKKLHSLYLRPEDFIKQIGIFAITGEGKTNLAYLFALQLLRSKVPFIVVQAPPTSRGFEKIVFPLDFRRENKEKINWIYYIARLYNSTFYIIKYKVTDKKFKKGVTSNLMFTEKFLKSNDIPYEIHTSPGKKDFTHETIDFAHEINADLLLIMTTKDIGIADYVVGANEQQIISNQFEIPVMCVNPRPGKFGQGFSATGG